MCVQFSFLYNIFLIHVTVLNVLYTSYLRENNKYVRVKDPKATVYTFMRIFKMMRGPSKGYAAAYKHLCSSTLVSLQGATLLPLG